MAIERDGDLNRNDPLNALQIRSDKSSKLIKMLSSFSYNFISNRKLENFCIFVISNNKSFISQNLKVAGPLGGKFDFFSPSDLKFKAILIRKPQKSSSTLSEL